MNLITLGLNICTEPTWNMEWGGSFDVYTDGWNIESVPYIPNRGIIFDPTQRHKGMSPTRYCSKQKNHGSILL